MAPFFSVVIPVYNKERCIHEMLDSVMSQEGIEYEIILVNDGSTDGSLELLRSYKDARVHLFTIDNSGPSAARNYGIRQAIGEWIVVLDADDLFLPDALKIFYDAICHWPSADMIVSDYYDEVGIQRDLHLKRHKKGIVRNPFYSWFNRQIMPRAGAFACKRSFMLDNPYKEYLRRSEDNEMMFNLFRVACIVSIPAPTMVYRHRFSTESSKMPPIELDFKGYLSFDRDKTLLEKICLYELYIEAKNVYPEETAKLYCKLRKRYLLIFAYHAAFWGRFLLTKIR